MSHPAVFLVFLYTICLGSGRLPGSLVRGLKQGLGSVQCPLTGFNHFLAFSCPPASIRFTMTSDSTLYFTAVEDMFKEMLTIEVDDSVPGNEEGSGLGSDSETPKRCVQLRKQKLFAQDSASFVISRRSPRLESKINLELHLSPGRQRELRAEEILQQRKDRAVKERQKPPQRRLTLRL